MKVYVLIGLRDGFPYEDPGAEEFISVHATRCSADETARAAYIKDGPPHGEYRLNEHTYDDFEIREVEVQE